MHHFTMPEQQWATSGYVELTSVRECAGRDFLVGGRGRDLLMFRGTSGGFVGMAPVRVNPFVVVVYGHGQNAFGVRLTDNVAVEKIVHLA